MKKLISILLCAVLLFSAALPVLALGVRGETSYPTPAGYDDHDYQKLIAFLLTEGEDGTSNVEKLRWFYQYGGLEFDLSDPSTWGRIDHEIEEEDYIFFTGIIWTNEEVKRLRGIDIEFEGDFGYEQPVPCGDLDLSGCMGLDIVTILSFDLDSIDVSGCTSLRYLGSLCRRLGRIDVSGCTELLELDLSNHSLPELDVSDCSKLTRLQCAGEYITGIDLSNCPFITFLNLSGCPIDELDVSPCMGLETLMCELTNLHELSVAGFASLRNLYCPNCEIESLDLSGCSALVNLSCRNNRLTELDLSDCPCSIDHVSVEGSGYAAICLGTFGGPDRVIAEPADGAEFLGWYSADGEFVSEDLELRLHTIDAADITAWFTTPLTPIAPGDANQNGVIEAADALVILRCALGIEGLTPDIACACDVNGDNSIDTTDALIVLRAALLGEQISAE